MGTPIKVDEAQRSLYVRVAFPLASLGPADYDARIEIFAPAGSYHQVDHQLVEEITRQLMHWGFKVDKNVDREVRQTGVEPCVKFTFYATNDHPDPEQSVKERLNLYVLRQIAQAKNPAAGTCSIEEFVLESTHNATKVTLTVTEGELDELDFEVLRRTEAIYVKKEPNGDYTFYINVLPTTEDSIYNPAITSASVAKWMGLFLEDPIPEPERVSVYREPDVIEAQM